MRNILVRLIIRNIRYFHHIHKKVKGLTEQEYNKFTRNSYSEIFILLRYLYLTLAVIYTPFAGIDLYYFFTRNYENPRMVLFDCFFYLVVIVFLVFLNFINYKRKPFWARKAVSRLGVYFISFLGTLINLILLNWGQDVSIFAATQLSIAIMFRFPDKTKFYIYAINFGLFFLMGYNRGRYDGLNSSMLMQNTFFIMMLVLVLDRVTYLNLVKGFFKNAQINRLNQKIIQEDSRKSELIRIAAHDLKSPLAGIVSITRIIKEDYNAFSDEKKKAIINDISESSGKVLTTIDEIINLTSLEAGNYKINIEEVDASGIMENIIQNLSYQMLVKKIKINLETSGLNQPFRSDMKVFSHVVENILSNAVKYSPIESDVNVQMSRIQLKRDYLNVRVEDRGQGFSREDKTQLFEKFSKLSARPTMGESSTGVGLYIVARLLELIEGEIKIEDNPGGGTLVQVFFPVM